jgi:hypothetical protein
MGKNLLKRKLMRQQLLKYPYPFKWVPGVLYYSSDPAFSKYTKNGVESYVPHSRLNGVVGCWIAHSHAIEDVTETEGVTIILEDDFVCRPSFFDKALTMLERFDRDFDIIFFDPRGSGGVDIHLVYPNIYRPMNSFPSYEFCGPQYYCGSQCLFINNRSISKILNIKLECAIKDIDGFLLMQKDLNTYVFYTGISKALWLGSDIEEGCSSDSISGSALDEWNEYTSNDALDQFI